MQGGWAACIQPSINHDDLITEFTKKAVIPLDIGWDLAEFILGEMDKEYTQKKEEQQKILASINRRLGQIEVELKNLFEMRVGGRILPLGDKSPDEVYEEYLSTKEAEKKRLLEAKNRVEQGNGEWKQKASNFLSECCNAPIKFPKAKEEKQYLFLRRITSNVFLDRRQLVVTHRFPFSALLKPPGHPNVLPSPKLSIQAKIKASEPSSDHYFDPYSRIIQAFQDIRYIGELRQRWNEIKRLKSGLSVASST